VKKNDCQNFLGVTGLFFQKGERYDCRILMFFS
jgi:hypothetical protein